MEESFPDDICRPPLMHHSSRIVSLPAPHHPEVGKGIGNGAQLAEEVSCTKIAEVFREVKETWFNVFHACIVLPCYRLEYLIEVSQSAKYFVTL
jgi:hypothetical protein